MGVGEWVIILPSFREFFEPVYLPRFISQVIYSVDTVLLVVTTQKRSYSHSSKQVEVTRLSGELLVNKTSLHSAIFVRWR